ncbi:Uncharacterised protein [Vibrio cholerae]|nr:Uncharacterised protein [Vibrio cholerae]
MNRWPVIQVWRFAPLVRRSSHLTGWHLNAHKV